MAGAPPQSPRKYSLSAAFRHPANSLIGGWCRIVRRIRRPCFLLGLFHLQLAMLADACNCARPSRVTAIAEFFSADVQVLSNVQSACGEAKKCEPGVSAQGGK